MATHEYSVEVQPDFLERQAKALPVSAVAELIWNGLDADATTIEVEFGDDSLGGMSRIAVSDNGHGIPFSDAPTLFRNLGGSWKKRGARTKNSAGSCTARKDAAVSRLLHSAGWSTGRSFIIMAR